MSSEAELTHDEAVADVRAFVDAVESTHPAPFARAGGRFTYYRRAQSVIDDLPTDGCSERALREVVAGLASNVAEYHTFVVHPAADGTLPVSLGIVDGAIRVRAAEADGRRELVGARLGSVDGTNVADLVGRQARLRGSETPHGDLGNLLRSLRKWRSLPLLLDREDSPDRVGFEFELPDGTTRTETLGPTADGESTVGPSTLDRPTSEGWPAYRLLPDRDAAWLVIPSMTDYREHYELFRDVLDDLDALDDETLERVRSLASAHTGEPAPDDIDDAIDGIPSALAIFRELAAEMAAAETETLVVDVRGNEGGNRLLADLLAYVLYGWEGVATARDRPSAIRYSDRFVAERGTGPFDHASEGRDWDLHPGEYVVDDGDPSVEELQHGLGSLPTFERLEAPDWSAAARYTPSDLVVVTDARTLSAGFSLLAALRRLGAAVVGTAPVQAPTYFGDLIGFSLPNSGIEAKTATTRIETLPDGPDEVLEPDRRLTSEAFDRYDYDRDASVLLALDEYC
ncbi:S41 family peptidase [Halosimplex halophilum]|uniref:S41 family peptidase n=1 Tax=Halosimplex halophilum TaxID=2559572 RepID=UPI00143546C0|nr:S41 family peptidase [Halosimplex halophilum]